MRTVAILPVKTLRPRQAAADRRVPGSARAGGRDGRRRARRARRRARARRGDRRDRPGRERSAPTCVIVHDPVEAGQSAAAARGIEAALERGAERVLLVPGDCPALDPGEVSALLEITRRRRDRARTATGPERTRCCSRRRRSCAPAFGEGSFARHTTARRGGGRVLRRSPTRARWSSTSTRPTTSRRCAAPWAHARAAPRAPAGCSRTPRLLELRRAPGPAGDPARGRPGGAAGAPPTPGLRSTDVVAIAHKVGLQGRGADRAPGRRRPGRAGACRLAHEHDKDPRHVEVVLSEAAEVVRADAGRLICRTRHGFVCANAGVDASNAGEPDSLVLLPLDPDALGPGAARRAARAPGGGDHRQLRPRVARGPVRDRDRDRRPPARWRTGAGCPTASGASCTPR